MTAIRIVDDHLELANIGSRTHAQIDTAIDSLTDNSIADALHRHSELVASDGSPDPALSVDATGKVGIGTTSPGSNLVKISKDQNAITNIDISNTTNGTGALASMTYTGEGGKQFRIAIAPSAFTLIPEFAGAGYFDTNSNLTAGFIFSAAAGTGGKIRFYTGGRTSAHMRMIIANSGNIGIGTAIPATSAKVDITSTTGALLMSRMTTAQKNALTAVNGMVLYDSTLNEFQKYENSAWKSFYELHSIASHSDTTATGAELETLTDNSIADALHRHSELVASDGSPDPALSIDASGRVIINEGGRIQRNVNGSSLTLVGGQDPTGGAYLEFSGINRTNHLGDLSFWANTSTAYVGGHDHEISFGHFNGVSTWIRRLVIDRLGHIGIGTTTPATSALLDLTSTTGAILLTRMTTTQRDALTAANGMVLYNTTLNKFQGYENGAWTSLI